MLALLVGFLVFWASAFFIIMGTSLLLGWIPIFMCATDIYMNVGEGFFGKWALLSIWIYSACSAGVVALMFLKPDPDGLPPGWKFLTMFYTYETVEAATASLGDDTSGFDGNKYVEAVKKAPSSVYHSINETRQMEKATERLNREAERVHSASKLAEASIELEQIKARQKALEEYLKGKK